MLSKYRGKFNAVTTEPTRSEGLYKTKYSDGDRKLTRHSLYD